MLQAKQDANANPLIKAVAQDFAEGDARTLATGHIKAIFKGAQASDLKTRAAQELRSQRCSMLKPCRMRRHSRPGYATSLRRPLRRQTRAGFWGSAGSRERCREGYACRDLHRTQHGTCDGYD